MSIAVLVIIIEVWILWSMCAYTDTFLDHVGVTIFYGRVFCALICLMCFNQRSVITQSTSDGEILRQVFIGK